MEKLVNRCYFFIDQKNLQKSALAGELISVYSYYMIIPSSQSQFLILELFKYWLTVVLVLVSIGKPISIR